MEEYHKQEYLQDAHLRYIVDYYNNENGREIRSRKTYLVFLFTCIPITVALAWFLPGLASMFAGILCALFYLIGKEIGRRDGYVKAYQSLLNFDQNYLARWVDLRNKDLESEVGLNDSVKNVSKFLNHIDFPLNIERLERDQNS